MNYDNEKPTKSMFLLAIQWIAFGIALLCVTWFLILPLFGAGKIFGREAQKFDAETSAQVYDNSRQYQQGINRDVARYCREYKSADGAVKAAVATLIQDTVSTYQGPLTPANQFCIEGI